MSGSPSVQKDQSYPTITQGVNDNPTVETPKGNERTLAYNRGSATGSDKVVSNKNLASG